MATPAFKQPLSALDICLLYGIGASAWILLSGYLTGYVSADADTLQQIELIKGLSFVAVTTVLLWLILRHTSVDPLVAGRLTEILPGGWLLLGFGSVLILMVPLSGYGVLRLAVPPLERGTYTDLYSIAELQRQSIALWERERAADLQSLAITPEFIADVSALQAGRDAGASARLRKYLDRLARRHRYYHLKLASPGGEVLVEGERGEPGAAFPGIVEAGSNGGTGQKQALYLEQAPGRLRQDFVQPVTGDEGRPLAYLVGSTLPGETLFREVGNLEQTYETVETLLVRVDAERVITQHITQIESGEEHLRVEPAAQDEVAQAISGTAAATRSLALTDHHGNEVLAVITPFDERGWQLVAKVDREEAIAPARQLAMGISAVVFFALSVVSVMLVMLWIQQRRLFRVTEIAREAEHEHQLREQAAVYRDMFEANPHAMWIYHRHTRQLLEANDAAVAHYGYTRGELLSMTLDDLEVAKDDQRDGSPESASGQQSTSDGMQQHLTRDGALIQVEMTSKPIEFEGEDACLAVAYDVTEREIARQKLQASERFALDTIDSLPGEVSVINDSGVIIAVNRKWRQFGLQFGVDAKHANEGTNYLDVCRRAARDDGDPDAATVLWGLEALMAGRRAYFHHEYPCVTPLETRWFAVHLTSFPDANASMIVAFHEDVTDRRNAEQELRKINRYYSALSGINGALVRSRESQEMIRQVCEIAATHTDLRLVCTRQLVDGKLAAVGHAFGPAAGLFDELDYEDIDLDIRHSALPGALAINRAQSVVINDFTQHDLARRWGHVAEQYGICSMVICPIIRRNDTWGILEFFAGEKHFFSTDLTRLLEEITADLGYSLDMIELDQHRRAAEAELLLHAEIIKSSHEGLFITDHNNQITMVNPSMCEITGYTSDELLGKNPRVMKSGYQSESFYQEMWGQLVHTGRWEGEIWDRRKNGEVFPAWLSITRTPGSTPDRANHIAIYRDITERKEYESYIEHLATHDILTDLPNRSMLQERLDLMLGQARREETQLALLFIDLDHFKLINDTLGHEIGDQLLKRIGSRIKRRLRDSDSVSRIGGDEFIALLGKVHSREDVTVVAEKILREISRPMTIQDRELVVTASIGISLYPQHGADIQGLMHFADVAMLAAKRSGHDRYQVYSGEIGENAGEHLALLNDLRGATDRGEVFLVFQPQVELRSLQLTGAEALVRWRHPERGLIPPDRFIPIAEDSGLIISLGQWILREACRTLAAWRDTTGLELPVSVNVSVLQFRQEDFVAGVRTVLEETGLPPELLELEVTESLLMVSAEKSLRKVKELHAMGIRVAIDDFGTGYSSMAYLRQLAPHRLKIDKSFVDDVPEDPNAVSIVKAIVQLAGAVGVDTIAEGVETEDQGRFLREIACSQAQGYFYSRPLPAEAFVQWIEAWQIRN